MNNKGVVDSIGVIGAGFVGGALIRGFSGYVKDILVYDKGKNIGDIKEVVKAEMIFLCLPTPMHKEGHCDTSIVEEVLIELDSHLNIVTPVIIRSTVPPRFFNQWESQLKYCNLIYMPEFLTERTADLDFINSPRFIAGVGILSLPSPSDKKVKALFAYRFPRTRFVFMQWEEAALVKYATNSFFTVKLSYFNEIYGIAKKLGVDPDSVIQEVLQDGRIGRSHFQVPGHDGDMGWGGHCFPKDNRAFSSFLRFDLYTDDHTMVDAAWEVNERVREDRDWEKQKGRAVSEDFDK